MNDPQSDLIAAMEQRVETDAAAIREQAIAANARIDEQLAALRDRFDAAPQRVVSDEAAAVETQPEQSDASGEAAEYRFVFPEVGPS